MAYNKRNWKARQGTGLNYFSIDGATPVPIVNQPTTLTEAGDALSAGNLNDWEQRIADAFDDADASIANVQAQVDKNAKEIENLKQTTELDEQTVQYPDDGNYSSIMPDGVPARVAKYASWDRSRGKTRAWNQLQNNGDFSENSGWSGRYCTTSIDTVNKIATLTVSSDGTERGLVAEQSLEFPIINGHKYYLGVDINAPISTVVTLSFGGGSMYGTANITANAWNNCGCIISSTDTSTARLYALLTGSMTTGQTIRFRNAIVRDLTTILDDWNPADITTANIPLMVQQIPDLLKYDNLFADGGNGYTLVDTEVEGVESKGKNLAQINNFTQSTSYGTEVPCVLKGGSTYTASGTVGGGSTLRLLKSDGTYQYIGLTENFDETFVAEADITEATFFGAVTVSNFQVEQGSTATTFAPWVNPSTLMLSAPVPLKSAGNVAEVLDVQTGKKTRPIGSVDLSTLNWSTAGGYKYTTIADMVDSGMNSLVLHNVAICEKYFEETGATQSSPNSYSILGQQIWILTSETPSGMCNYQLATPLSDEQVCDPIIDNTIEVQAGGTIRTIQSQSPIIDNCLDVTYDFIPA